MQTAFPLSAAHELSNQIIAWRRDFHQHPELGFEEVRTAGIVAQTLRDLGMEVVTGIAKTGVMGILGEGSPVIALRADMDALPIVEATEASYSSITAGKMHACGHDSHTAMMLGVARMLAHMPDRPAGEIRFLFQPCEETMDSEGKSGGGRMVEEGALDGVDKVIALHVASTLPAGKIVIEDGHITASVDDFDVKIIGRGSHAAHPDQGIDPIFLTTLVTQAIYAIRSRRIDPMQTGLISIGTINGGSAHNIVPTSVSLSGTIRSYNSETRWALWRELETAFSLARVYGGDYELKKTLGCPATYNDPGVASVIRAAAADLFGMEAVIRERPSMGGEDFSYMTEKAPGAMFMLGAKRDEVDRPHHNPLFDLDESIFANGTALLAETALRLLRGA